MPALNSAPKIKIGTVRADGFVFRGYDKRRGDRREHWISPAAAAKRKQTTKRLGAAHYKRIQSDPVRLASFNKRMAGYAHKSRRKNPALHMLARAKVRAKQLGLPFDLILDDIVVPSFCPVLGIAIEVQTGKPSDNSPELDKIIPELGYVRGNIIVISRKANRIKTNATIDEIRMVADFYSSLIRRS